MKKKDKHDWNMPPYPPLGMPLDPLGVIITDPMGGFTGVPVDLEDDPVQDMDDL